MKATTDFRFRLYITGNAPHSMRAMANLDEFCRCHLPGRHQIEVVDLLLDPQRALADAVHMTPTLVRLAPGPELRIRGNLSDFPTLLASLGLAKE